MTFIHQKLKKYFGVKKDTGKLNCSQFTLEWTVSANFTAKCVMYKENKSLFQLLDCYYSTFSHIPLFLTINCPVTNV